MLFDDEPTEHEPDPPAEPGPGDVGPEVPEAPNADLAERDVPTELQRQFWTLVGVFNVALFASALGVMLVAFEGRLRLGGGLVLLGIGAFAVGLRRYRRVRNG